MRNTFLTTAFFIASTLFAFAGDNNKAISEIGKTFSKINTYKKYDVKSIEMGDCCGYGSLTGYYKNETLEKVVDYFESGDAVEITEYYYADGELVFVYQIYKEYQLDEEKDAEEQVVYEGRFYLNKGEIIKEDVDGESELYLTPTGEYHWASISTDNIQLLNSGVSEVSCLNDQWTD